MTISKVEPLSIRLTSTVLMMMDKERESDNFDLLEESVIPSASVITNGDYFSVITYLSNLYENDPVYCHEDLEVALIKTINDMIQPMMSIKNLSALEDLKTYTGEKALMVKSILSNISQYFEALLVAMEDIKLPERKNMFVYHKLHQILYMSKNHNTNKDNTAELRILLDQALKGDNRALAKLTPRPWSDLFILVEQDDDTVRAYIIKPLHRSKK